MRRPHVYQRTGRLKASKPKVDKLNAAEVANVIADQLAPLIEAADGVGEVGLGDLLDTAQEEAERIALRPDKRDAASA